MTRFSWRGIIFVALSLSFLVVAGSFAADDEGGKGKGKTVQKQAKGKKQFAEGKKQVAEGKKQAATNKKAGKGFKGLPPGLANKPADHPGRVNFIKNVLGGKAPPTKAQPGQKPKKSKGGDEDSNGDDEE